MSALYDINSILYVSGGTKETGYYDWRFAFHLNKNNLSTSIAQEDIT